MKLFRFGMAGFEQPGVLINEKKYALHGFRENYDEIFFHTNGLMRLKEYISHHAEDLVEINTTERIGPPICRPSKIICIGLNYSDHSKESGMSLPSEPIIFFKSTGAICGPYDDVIIPKNSKKTDWEAELAVVIGKKATYISQEQAMDFVAGYCLHNDYSEREFQLEHEGQWVKGKSCDTFAPLGPYLVTPNELPDVHNLRLWLTVNGQMMQDSNTSYLIFKIPFLISYISQFMTLFPGDVISTGTPAGVALGMKPEPVYLKPGDIVEMGIDGLGTSLQVLKAYNSNA
ncbi:MAG: fumarylacetoacetate hydrolase family protein [Ginsengibacter sp.]